LGLDHRPGRLAAAAKIVSGDLRDHLGIGAAVGDVDGEDWNPRRVRLGNHRPDRLGIAGAQHDRRHLPHDEILHLIPLPGHIFFSADNESLVALSRAAGCDRIANHLEKGIVEREQRNTDRAPRWSARSLCRRARRRPGRLGLAAAASHDQHSRQADQQPARHAAQAYNKSSS